jgi:hypothetical protein
MAISRQWTEWHLTPAVGFPDRAAATGKGTSGAMSPKSGSLPLSTRSRSTRLIRAACHGAGILAIEGRGADQRSSMLLAQHGPARKSLAPSSAGLGSSISCLLSR